MGTPVHDRDGKIRSLGTHITLSRMDSFLNDIVKNNAAAVIIDKNTGELVAKFPRGAQLHSERRRDHKKDTDRRA